jgi:adhesin transport system membrane fusion protein
MTADRYSWVDPADLDRGGSRIFSHLLLLCVLAVVASFIVWANFAVLDEVTRGEARIIPSTHVQVIQNLEGGILSEMLVHESEIVEKGQVLLRIDNTVAEANYRELRQRQLGGSAAVARLEAEVAGLAEDAIAFPEELLKTAPEIAEAERTLFRARRNQLESQLSVLRDQVKQRELELGELDNKRKRLKQSFDLAQQELHITRPLAKQGNVAQVDLLRLEREVVDLRGQIDAVTLARPRAEAALSEARNRIDEQIATFRREASKALSEKRLELSSVTAALSADTDRVRRTEVRSPVRGTVKDIKISTIGGVIQPGEDLIEIVPIEDTLLVEARIRPSDIAFIRPDQQAVVKITAYDYSIYGGLDAVVKQISADTIEDDEGQHFFRIRLRTNRNSLGTPEKPLPIIPGMTATVDILTGHKTVLEYLLKPILKARYTALRER